MRGLLLIGLLLAALPTRAQEEVVADLSQHRVAITTDFDGSEILVFGAVKREAPIDPAPLGVIVTVEGPPQTLTVWRKSRIAGVWANTSAVEIDSAPSFYAVATSAPVEDILLQVEDLRHRITPRRAIRSVGAPDEVLDSPEFTAALVRIREGERLYQINESVVSLAQETLFSTAVDLPANLVEGDYTVRIFLTRNREIIASFDTEIFVQKEGLERFLYAMAHERPFYYGMMSLIIAGAAGWGASAAARALRR